MYTNRKQSATDATAQPQAVRPVNDVDYGPPKPEDSQGIESSKDQTAKDPNAQPSPPSPTKLILNVTQAQQNGTQVIIRALVEGGSSGTCSLKLSHPNGGVIERSASITVQASYALCQGFTIPLGDIPQSGMWTATLTASSGGNVAEPVSRHIAISKE